MFFADTSLGSRENSVLLRDEEEIGFAVPEACVIEYFFKAVDIADQSVNLRFGRRIANQDVICDILSADEGTEEEIFFFFKAHIQSGKKIDLYTAYLKTCVLYHLAYRVENCRSQARFGADYLCPDTPSSWNHRSPCRAKSRRFSIAFWCCAEAFAHCSGI